MKVFKVSQFFGMSSYTFKIFLAEKYAFSALKCRIGRLHTRPEKIFRFKSEIYMEKHQKYLGSNKTGYPARLSTSYIYEAKSQIGLDERGHASKKVTFLYIPTILKRPDCP